MKLPFYYSICSWNLLKSSSLATEGDLMNIFFKLGWFFKERKKEYIIGISMLLFVAILQLIPPKIIGYTIDEIGTGKLTKA